MAFTNDMDWADYISEMDKMENVTKEQIMAFASENYQDNYVVVYKQSGEDPNKQQVEKPQITKVPLNREDKSDFNEMIAAKEVEPLSPVFLDYEKDIATETAKSNISIYANQNNENELFSLYYLTDLGSNNDPKLSVAVEYLEYLGTEELTAEEFKKELYKIGCSFNVFSSGDQTYVMLNGLDENMEVAMELFESLLKTPKADQEALDNMVDGVLKEREDAKKNKGNILWSGLMNYGKFGPKSTFTNVLSNNDLTQLQAEELTEIIRGISNKEHRILYYGPRNATELVAAVNDHHQVPEQLEELPDLVEFAEVEYDEPQVYWTDYDMVQAEVIFLSKGQEFDKEVVPASRLFNEYYGALTFQEIREAQGLAYSVFSSYQNGGKADKADYIMAYIGTQADKQAEAMEAIINLMNNMPESEEDFETAREAVINKIESERITKARILWNYENAKDRDLDYDIRKDVYEKVKTMTFDDLKQFHETYIKGKNYVTVVIGSRDKLNFEDLQKYGQVRELTLEELFGYEKVERIDREITPGTD
jgi:predicted Zn-dependent peptidase